MRWLPLSALILCISCTISTDYVDRVVQDVTAMLEGMAAAHASDQVVLIDPNIRSSRQPK
jgi:hypothetical protein